jgi:hypothetical protein
VNTRTFRNANNGTRDEISKDTFCQLRGRRSTFPHQDISVVGKTAISLLEKRNVTIEKISHLTFVFHSNASLCGLRCSCQKKNKRIASEERRETSAIAYVQHGTVTAPRYYKIGEGCSTVESVINLY